jgi:hypothetical protein
MEEPVAGTSSDDGLSLMPFFSSLDFLHMLRRMLTAEQEATGPDRSGFNESGLDGYESCQGAIR